MSGTRETFAYFTVGAWIELPEDDLAADDAFDTICDAVKNAVSGYVEGVIPGSVSIKDADTRESE